MTTAKGLKSLGKHDKPLSDCTKDSPMPYIEKRGDSWRAQVRRKGHPTISKTFSRKVLAERWAREVELSIEQQTFKNDDPDVGQLAQRYISEILPLRPAGRTKRETIAFLSRRLAGVKLSELTPAWFIDYAKERAVAPATLSQDIIFLGAVLEAADVIWGLRVDLGAFKRARTMLGKQQLTGKAVERDRRASDEELARVLACVRSTLPMADLVAFAVDSCMRQSEQFGLLWEDLDRENRTILIRDRKHPKVKLGNNQRVPLLGRTMEVIGRQRQVADRIFPFAGDSVSAAFRRAAARAKVEDLCWHDLRHEGISRLFESRQYGIPEVALVSGHRSWEQLKRYTNIRAESLHRD